MKISSKTQNYRVQTFFCWKTLLGIESYPCKLTPQAGKKSRNYFTTTYQQIMNENQWFSFEKHWFSLIFRWFHRQNLQTVADMLTGVVRPSSSSTHGWMISTVRTVVSIRSTCFQLLILQTRHIWRHGLHTITVSWRPPIWGMRDAR